ncbi:ABC transporter substrate-binding protein [Bacillus horti]|uniref:Aldouronate transport system substrate-binding protein n=1 Tax=Caldalkalibacillus horti TaxID=77523 RepID=A0ABT9W2J7_9BACI|nr:ABC transporter substrate-binding protein [Bacillus horti]MDQ0167467.1 putative aldouronate transport system substrate-binding protein [Bacillus horti]
MFKRKTMFFILSLVFMLVLVGCSSDESSTQEETVRETETDESEGNEASEYDTSPVTYTFFNAQTPGKDIDTNQTRIGKLFEEQTGVNFRVEHIVGDVNTRIGTMVASGQYPDMISPDVAIDILLDAGAFIPLDDLLEEYGPNILEAYGPYLDLMRQEDGKIYYIPFGATHDYIPNPNIDQGAFWIQRSVLKEFGYPEITTFEEYFDLIEEYHALYPQRDGSNTIGFTALTYDWRFFALANPPMHLAGYPNDGDVIVDMDTFEAKVYANSEYTKRYLQKLNELNSKGLFDREAFVANYDEYLAKLTSGRVLGFFDYGWQVNQAFDNLLLAGNDDHRYMALPIVFEETEKDQYLDPPAFISNRGVGITVSADNPERIIQYFDNMIKEENQRLIMWGFEGEHYEVGDDGRFYRTNDQIALLEDRSVKEDLGMWYFEWNWPRLNGQFSDGNAVEPRRQAEVARAAYREGDLDILGMYGLDVFADLFAEPDERPWFPAWSANIEQGSAAQIFEQRSDDLKKRHFPRIVLASPADFEQEWEAFVTEYNKLDIEAFESLMTDVVKQRIDQASGQ